MSEKLNTANTPEEMEELVKQAAARLAIIRAQTPSYAPIEWFINEVIEETL